jgi:AmmeMemoRadiSam system protein B
MTRNAIFAGRWYPAEPDQLDELVNWKPEEGGKARIAILPHAGLYFSHRGIAHFFSRMEDGVDRIIILSPSHYYYLRPDRILTADYDAYRTPYGVLEGKPLKGFDTGGEAEIQQEHAVEMVLPFIAKKGGIAVSSGLISQVSDPEPLAETILSQMDAHTALIASSDFTHYGLSFDHVPYGERITVEVRDKVAEEDKTLAMILAQNKGKEALAFARGHRSTVCGIAPNAIASCVAKHLGLSGEVVDYYTSFDLGGGDDSFVGYATVLWE